MTMYDDHLGLSQECKGNLTLENSVVSLMIDPFLDSISGNQKIIGMPKCAYFWIKMKWGTRAFHRVALFNIQSTVIPIPHSTRPYSDTCGCCQPETEHLPCSWPGTDIWRRQLSMSKLGLISFGESGGRKRKRIWGLKGSGLPVYLTFPQPNH